MLLFEKWNAFVQHLSYVTNDDLSLNADTIADASKTQSKYAKNYICALVMFIRADSFLLCF